MIVVRKNADPGRGRLRGQQVRIAFGGQSQDHALAGGFGDLGGLSELRLSAGDHLTPGPDGSAVLITYVHTGAYAPGDPGAGHAVAYAGEFLRSPTPPALHDRVTRATPSAGARLFRISLRLAEPGPNRHGERARFSMAQRHHKLCPVVSPDARDGSLAIGHDVVIHSGLLDPGHHVAYELTPGRTVWIHMVSGVASLDDIVLSSGDSAGVWAEPRASLIARETTELLVIDLGSSLVAPTWRDERRQASD